MKAFVKLIRWPNLLIIVLIQVMLRYFIISPVLAFSSIKPAMSTLDFFLLVLATVLISAAGYIINDIFDVDTDRINKPNKNVVGKKISFDLAKKIYYVLNFVAVVLGFYLAFRVGAIQLGLIFLIIIIMLHYYSSKYQMVVLWGNLVVALLSGFTVYIVWLFEFFALRNQSSEFLSAYNSMGLISVFVWAYFGFAFLTTFIREIVKDIEDVKGDMKVGFRTLPAVFGIPVSKTLALIISGLSIVALACAQYFLYEKGFTSATWYLAVTVQLIFLYFFYQLVRARNPIDYKFLSSAMKIIMVAGIISMQLIYLDF
jgi:4-hydroxybenzoate polyprenyltransferase